MIRKWIGVKWCALALVAAACLVAPAAGRAQSWSPGAWANAASSGDLADARGSESYLRLSESGSGRQPAPVPTTRGPVPAGRVVWSPGVAGLCSAGAAGFGASEAGALGAASAAESAGLAAGAAAPSSDFS